MHVHDEDLAELPAALQASRGFTLREATFFGLCSACGDAQHLANEEGDS